MIKRPLDPRFSAAVKAGLKFTTIRDNPWPVGVPIMLYHWSGAPYRSHHVDVAPVTVSGFWTIRITQNEDGQMHYEHGMVNDTPIHKTEGFPNPEAMDDWFRPLVKRGQTVAKTLMRFSLSTAAAL